MQASTQTEPLDMIVTESRKLRLVKVEMKGDGARFERETMRQHWMRCEGCEICWPEIIERESDI